MYEEGYVVVTRAAKKAFLQSASRMGKLAADPDAQSLDDAWGQVAVRYRGLLEEDSN